MGAEGIARNAEGCGVKTSERGLNLIKASEGCRLYVYADIGGVKTCGYGHVCPTFELGQTITQDQADNFLSGDLAHTEMAVLCQVNVPLTQNQFDALVSFTFNVGAGNLHDSTLLKKLNLGEYRLAANWFLPWCKVHGREIEGLMHRRHAEMKLFLEPDGSASV